MTSGLEVIDTLLWHRQFPGEMGWGVPLWDCSPMQRWESRVDGYSVPQMISFCDVVEMPLCDYNIQSLCWHVALRLGFIPDRDDV